MPSSWREARLAKRKAEDTSKDTSKDTSEVPGTGDDGYGVKLSAAKRLRLERDRIIAGGRKAARTDGKLADADAEEAPPEENVEESVATPLDQAEVMRSKIAEMSEAEQAKTEQGEAY